MAEDRKFTPHNRKANRIVIHLCFCIGTLWCFCNFSVLRPSSICLAKEFLIGVSILAMVYINYFYFIPKILFAHRMKLFWIISTFSLLLITVSEIWIVNKDISPLLNETTTLLKKHVLYLNSYLWILLRNTGLFCFILVLRMIEHYIELVSLTQQSSLNDGKTIHVKDTKGKATILNLDDIVYCVQNQNYTSIYSSDSKKYIKYSSLIQFTKI